MVDFNNESTVATPPGDVIKIVILERREQFIEALEEYHSVETAELDTQQKERFLRARLMALWYQLQAIIKRRYKPGEYEQIKQSMAAAHKPGDIVDAYEFLNEFIDDIGLTYIDNRAKYDRTNVEDSNEKKGM